MLEEQCGSVPLAEWTGLTDIPDKIQQFSMISEVFIGAGSTVVKNIGAGIKAYGNPCREVERIV